MSIQLRYDGQTLYWNAPGDTDKFKASSGLVVMNNRMFRVGNVVYAFREDYRCTFYQRYPDHGPIPTGTYTVATTIPKNPYATFNATSCDLQWSNSIQVIPRGGDAKAAPSGATAGSCEPYWSNWGFNRAALVPHPDMVAKNRGGFFLHDSSKGYTHGCVETEQRFFTDKLIPAVKADPGVEITLTVKYDASFHTFGGTYATAPNTVLGGVNEDAQKECLGALFALTLRLAGNAPQPNEEPFVTKYPPLLKLTIDPPDQSRLLPYDNALSFHYGANDISAKPDLLSNFPSWWGNFK